MERNYKSILASDLSAKEMGGLLTATVTPRPIALVSSISAEGKVNLSPFSFFNAFSMNPPILVFSPSRRVRDNTTKHTLHNARESSEVVINLVTESMAEQCSLSSTEYEEGVNEFEKAGFTALTSTKVKPPRVGESPVAFECRVNDIVELGQNGGAGNLVICEVLCIHIDQQIYVDGAIDPIQLNTIARLGQNYYSKTTKEGLFEIQKPLASKGIGIDNLPRSIAQSNILTGSDLAKLANVEQIPELDENRRHTSIEIGSIEAIHKEAQKLLIANKIDQAWQLLLSYL